MDTITISILIAITGCAIGISSWIKQGKHDSAGMENRLASLENMCKDFNIIEITKTQQIVKELSKRVEKLDTDVEKKIDQLSEKVDGLLDKMQELLLEIAKKN
jgi:hypothetical protein